MTDSEQKKPVWKKSREDAKQNLRLKRDVLKHFVTHGIPWKLNDDGSPVTISDKNEKPIRVLDFFPKSETEFAKWTMVKSNPKFSNCKVVSEEISKKHGNFKSNNRDTLKSNQHLHSQVKALLKAVKERSNSQIVNEDSSDLLVKLNADLDYYKAVCVSEGTMMQEAISSKAVIEKELKVTTRALNEAKTAMDTVIKTKHLELAAKDVEISTLKKQLLEVNSFKEVRNK